MEQKIFAIDHKNAGKSYSDIRRLYKDRFGVLVPSSTLSTWYSAKCVKKVLDLCVNFKVNQVTCGVTRLTNIQRLRIMIDTEYFLVRLNSRCVHNGAYVTKSAIKHFPV